MSLSSLKLHNAMWPGLVGKADLDGKEIRDLVDVSELITMNVQIL